MFNQMSFNGQNPTIMPNPNNPSNNMMPYAYGMTSETPLPSMPSPVSTLPPLYPSTFTPQLNPQAPFTTQNMMQSRYAHGGHVHPRTFEEMAHMLQDQGDEDDTILAHINPEEAFELGTYYGVDINPITGLPQFGKFRRKLKKAAKKIGHAVKTVAHKTTPVAGALVGNFLMPGLGAPLGGALANAVRAKIEHKDPLKAAMRGAQVGGLLSAGLPLAGQAATALGAPNLGAGLQQIGAGQLGEGLSTIKEAAFPSMAESAAHPFTSPSLAAAIAEHPGMLAESPAGALVLHETANGPIYAPFGADQVISASSLAPSAPMMSSYGAGALPMGLGAIVGSPSGPMVLHETEQGPVYERVSPESLEGFGRKGKSPLTGVFKNLGQKLRMQRSKSQDAFGSLLGQMNLSDVLLPVALGGTLLRKEKMKENPANLPFEDVVRMASPETIRKMWGPQDQSKPLKPYSRKSLPLERISPAVLAGERPYYYPEYFEDHNLHLADGGYIDGHTNGQDDEIPAMLSDGEFVIPADVVSAQGDGNNEAGAKQFYEYIETIRKHKGLKNKLPPKAKSLFVYMQKRSKR